MYVHGDDDEDEVDDDDEDVHGDDDDDDGQELAQVLQKWTAAAWGRGSYELRHVLRLSVNTLHIVFSPRIHFAFSFLKISIISLP